MKECLAQDGNEALDQHEGQAQEFVWLHTRYIHTHTQTLLFGQSFSLTRTHTLTLSVAIHTRTHTAQVPNKRDMPQIHRGAAGRSTRPFGRVAGWLRL